MGSAEVVTTPVYYPYHELLKPKEYGPNHYADVGWGELTKTHKHVGETTADPPCAQHNAI